MGEKRFKVRSSPGKNQLCGFARMSAIKKHIHSKKKKIIG